jgi:hypothetical protein
MTKPRLFEPFTDEQELYKQFLLDHVDYAVVIGYNLLSDRGIREAMADNFLYKNFLMEKECSYC